MPSQLATLHASALTLAQLILALYQPAPPEVIARTQEALQRLQRSPSAWQFAQGLLERPNDQVKFFGVLIVIVKINTER